MKTSEFVVGKRNQSSCTPYFLYGFRRWLPGATALLVLSLCAGTPCFAEEIMAEAVERQVNLTPAQRLQTGVAGFRERVDSRGRIVRRMFIGPDGRPCFDYSGVAGWEADYNDRGQQTRISYLSTDGKSLMLSKEGVAEIRNSYDSRGFPVRSLFFGVDRKPCYAANGIAGWEAEYDSNGFQTRNACLDKDGNSLMMSREGVAEYRNSYDEKGRLAGKAFFDTTGKPCLAVNGAAGWTVEYDGSNCPVRTSYFGLDGHSPILTVEKVAGFRDSYDAAGRLVRREFFGLDGKPCLHSAGCAGWTAAYDVQGRQTALTYFDLSGKSVK